MDKKQVIRLLEKYQNGACSSDEIKLVEDFFSSYQADEDWIDWKHGDQTQVEQRIYLKLQKEIKSKSTPRVNIYKYAAALVILIVSAIVFYKYDPGSDKTPLTEKQFITKQTHRGQKTNIILGDGTFIRLNSESSLVYPTRFDKGLREVTLIGEAYFEVAEDSLRPFIIKSGELTTRVLGTSFNIRAYPNHHHEVTVSTGKVKVDSERGEEESIYLTRNQQVYYNLETHMLTKRDVDISQFLAWKNDHIVFNKVSMKEAASTLERWFNVEVVFENKAIENCIIRSEYKNENLINILESMKFILGIEYRLEDNQRVIISGESCENLNS